MYKQSVITRIRMLVRFLVSQMEHCYMRIYRVLI